jgi:hypothetical protein
VCGGGGGLWSARCGGGSKLDVGAWMPLRRFEEIWLGFEGVVELQCFGRGSMKLGAMT